MRQECRTKDHSSCFVQVAADRTHPTGHVIGIDVIPAQPPKGVSTIQGNFLSESVRDEVRKLLSELAVGNERPQDICNLSTTKRQHDSASSKATSSPDTASMAAKPTKEPSDSGLQLPRHQVVDVLLSDMSEPWATDSIWRKHLSDPYYRMMNTSGMNFRDHAGSIVSLVAETSALI